MSEPRTLTIVKIRKRLDRASNSLPFLFFSLSRRFIRHTQTKPALADETNIEEKREI